MKVSIKKLYNGKGQETGSILSTSFGGPTNLQEKVNIENILIHHGHDSLYPGEGLNIFSEHNEDTTAVIIIRDIDKLPFTVITIEVLTEETANR